MLVEQGGSVYSKTLATTGFPRNFDTVNFNGVFKQAEFTRLLGSGPATPDFQSGVATFLWLRRGKRSHWDLDAILR